MAGKPKSTFQEIADQQKSTGILRELWQFLRHNRKWWMAPIVVALLLVGLLTFLSGTAVAPFIYSLF
jgi:hypothetical protein